MVFLLESTYPPSYDTFIGVDRSDYTVKILQQNNQFFRIFSLTHNFGLHSADITQSPPPLYYNPNIADRQAVCFDIGRSIVLRSAISPDDKPWLWTQ